jgi:hypothetical protein
MFCAHRIRFAHRKRRGSGDRAPLAPDRAAFVARLDAARAAATDVALR